MARLDGVLDSFKMRPFKFIKRFLPATLLGRALVILITPVLLIQLIMGIVFWDRHWTKTTETLAEGIAGNVASLVEIAGLQEDSPFFFRELKQFASKNHAMHLERGKIERGFSGRLLRKTDWREDFLRDALSEKISYPFRLRVFEQRIRVEVAARDYIYTFEIDKKYLFPKTISIVIWWEVGAPLFFILIAIIFMRNQMRPLQSLAQVVEAFGRGRDVSDFKPSGALEVRRVSRAFNAMRDRIYKQITQRTEMLAGISHDLKTPLTRMQLQLAMLADGEEKTELLEEVRDMEKMLEEYLAFAKGQETEKEKTISLKDFLEDVFAKYPSVHINRPALEPTQDIPLVLRVYSMKRALKNIISNALRYGKNIWIQTTVTPRTLTLIFEDDGPGIPADKRQSVFRPFVRLDESRNVETGGYGLGLSITKDIVLSHGGRIFLEDSTTHGGLKVVVNLPV